MSAALQRTWRAVLRLRLLRRCGKQKREHDERKRAAPLRPPRATPGRRCLDTAPSRPHSVALSAGRAKQGTSRLAATQPGSAWRALCTASAARLQRRSGLHRGRRRAQGVLCHVTSRTRSEYLETASWRRAAHVLGRAGPAIRQQTKTAPSGLRLAWRRCKGRFARRRGARRRWRACSPLARVTPAPRHSGCRPRAASPRRQPPRRRWSQKKTRCALQRSVGCNSLGHPCRAHASACFGCAPVAAVQAAQHRHLRAHRQRQDDADGAHLVLHRPHPRDPRGAECGVPPAAAAASPACVARPAAAWRSAARDAAAALFSRIRRAAARFDRRAALRCRATPVPTLRLRAATSRRVRQVRGKDGVGAKMDSMDLEREKGITIKVRGPARGARSLALLAAHVLLPACRALRRTARGRTTTSTSSTRRGT